MEGLIEFFRSYADRTHHGKEEDLLFPAMIEKGFSREQGPIHCMLADHEHNRALTRAITETTEQYRGGDKSAGYRYGDSGRRRINFAGQIP
jgi:hemerythrin-like domain-containing protein